MTDSIVLPKKVPKVQLRLCIVCRQFRKKPELVRLARLKDGRLRILDEGKPRGKGVYLCRERRCIGEFLKNKKFRRMFRDKMTEEDLQRLRGFFTQCEEP